MKPALLILVFAMLLVGCSTIDDSRKYEIDKRIDKQVMHLQAQIDEMQATVTLLDYMTKGGGSGLILLLTGAGGYMVKRKKEPSK